MSSPLKIYLDSSDYSVFSDDLARTPEIIHVENQLLQLRDEGKIEIRFSYINIIEAAPIEPKDRDCASRRLKKIKEICAKKCLAEHHSVLGSEIKSLAMGGESILGDFNIFNEGGIWFQELIEYDEISDLKNDIKNEISKLPDRESRRKAERRAFNADGHIKRNFQSDLNNSITNTANNICNIYPISLQDAKLAVESYLGTGSISIFMQAISNSLSNLENLALWYEQSWDLITPLSSYFRKEGFDFKALLDKIKLDFVRLNSGSNNATQELLDNLLTSLPKSLANKFSESIGLSLKRDVSWELSPSIFTITSIAAHLAKHNVSTQRNSKTSDYGDIFHLIYLPHVDVFRADGNTASLINQAKLPIKTKVVAKLIDLPNEIHNLLLLKARTSNYYSTNG